MAATSPHITPNEHPLKLRELLHKACHLAAEHDVTSVMVGMAGREGDLLFPEMVEFVGSALRIDDGILRLTRERAVFFLADADRVRAEEIMDRLREGFGERFPTAQPPDLSVGYFEVAPSAGVLSVKDVLPALFAFERAETH
jgi:hypothetical protein